LNQNQNILAEKDGQDKMEKILGFRLQLISEKNEDLMYDILQNPAAMRKKKSDPVI
jgi:5'(3')-deoxyribonucleotidase